MSNPIKILKERIESLAELDFYNITRIKVLIDKAIDEINSMLKNEMKNLDDIETKIMIEERWAVMKRLWNNWDEFKMCELRIKINTEIEILKDEENKMRNVIDYLKNQYLKY